MLYLTLNVCIAIYLYLCVNKCLLIFSLIGSDPTTITNDTLMVHIQMLIIVTLVHIYIIIIWHKILCEIKFYSFIVSVRTVRLKSVNWYPRALCPRRSTVHVK